MIQNLEVRKQGEGYVVLEQAGSDYHKDAPVYQAATRAEAEAWLTQRGADQSQVSKALDDAASSDRVFIEIEGDYSEAEGFPKQP